jgi:malate dehydrogenase (oxaloacetate-decarboxylating)
MTKTITTTARGQDVLRNPLLYKGTAFSPAERQLLGLSGLMPSQQNTQEQQAVRFYEKLEVTPEPIDKYRSLMALQDRNEHLYYKVLMDHLFELMPIVYTPTVGLATQRFSAVFERGRGIWITPDHRGRIGEVMAIAVGDRDIALAVVTDNESILGIGDQGAGGMAISIGKLALYTAGAGIDPARTLPISLDFGTNNRDLLQNDLYLGWPRERLTGADYDSLVEEFVEAFQSLFPDALLQWEDFRKDNALTIMERYRHRLLSFNDDIQGTGAVALAGLFSALRIKNEKLSDQRIVILGAGAAGLGIARQIEAALLLEGIKSEHMYRYIAALDSQGLLVDDQNFRDEYKRDLAWPGKFAAKHGLIEDRSLRALVAAYQPTVLIGTSGQPGAFDETLVRTMAGNVSQPVIMPMSNPTANSEATPEDLVRWSNGRALIATGSPFAPVTHDGRTIEIGQGNNVFVFPAIGLGALLAGASEVTDTMITQASQALAEQITEAELARGLLYPDVSRLREVTAHCAVAVAEQAYAEGLASKDKPDSMLDAAIAAMWTPDYPEFV